MHNSTVQIGWLDFSEAEQRRAREYLRQFRAEGTIDELGFGIIRDAKTDIFFPATSTIMTRCRYLFFVATILLRVEQEQLSGGRAASRMKELEDHLRKLLSGEDSSETQLEKRGVIGALAKENLRRYPSSIYWNALKVLGLFQRPGWTQSYYFGHLAEFYKASTPKKDDDDLSHLAMAPLHNWDPALKDILPQTRGISGSLEFLPGIDFSLSCGEAHYLKSRFEVTNASSLPLPSASIT